MLNDRQPKKSFADFISKFDPYVLNIILLSLYIPLIGIHLASNKMEKLNTERKFSLESIHHFRNLNTKSVIYKILGIKEDLSPKG